MSTSTFTQLLSFGSVPSKSGPFKPSSVKCACAARGPESLLGPEFAEFFCFMFAAILYQFTCMSTERYRMRVLPLLLLKCPLIDTVFVHHHSLPLPPPPPSFFPPPLPSLSYVLGNGNGNAKTGVNGCREWASERERGGGLSLIHI